jgi:hypothetical protein
LTGKVTDADFYERFELAAWLPGEAELRIDVMVEQSRAEQSYAEQS